MGTATKFVPHDIVIEAHTFGFFRLIIGAPVLLVGAALLAEAPGARIRLRDMPLVALFGAMIALYQIAFFTAVQEIGVATGTLLAMGTTPLFTAAFSRLLLGERLPAAVFSAGLLAVMGVACLAAMQPPPAGTAVSISGLGAAAGLAGGAAFALVTILGRILTRRGASPARYTAVGFLFGAACLLPLSMSASIEIVQRTDVWPILIYLGAVATALAYLLYALGMKRLRSATAGASTTLLEPAAAVALAYMVLGERLDMMSWVGASLLFAALILLFRSEGSRSAAPSTELPVPALRAGTA